MSTKILVGVVAAVSLAVSFVGRPHALGKPGINPLPCPQQEWQLGDATFEALPGAGGEQP